MLDAVDALRQRRARAAAEDERERRAAARLARDLGDLDQLGVERRRRRRERSGSGLRAAARSRPPISVSSDRTDHGASASHAREPIRFAAGRAIALMAGQLAVDVRREAARCSPLPTLTRRSLLRAGAVAAAAALVGLRRGRAAPAAAAAGHLRRSSYDGLVGQSFSSRTVELRLLSVDRSRRRGGRQVAGRQRGRLRARVLRPARRRARGGHPRGAPPALGTFELFVSPVEQPRRDRRYEAVDRPLGRRAEVPAERRAKRARAPEARAAAPAVAIAAPRGARLLRRVALRRKGRGVRATICPAPGRGRRAGARLPDQARQDDRRRGARRA